MSIGTITSDAAIIVQYLRGGRLGTVEESFLARLRPGERFIFAGRTLEFVAVRDMTAWVRRAKAKAAPIPRWMGGRCRSRPSSPPPSAACSKAPADGVFAARRWRPCAPAGAAGALVGDPAPRTSC